MSDADAASAFGAKRADLDTWLRRLSGRFRIATGPYERLVDCDRVGEGPGVHCMIGPPPAATDPHPSAVLYGVAAEVPGIRYLQVNGKGIAESAVGKLSEATVSFPKVSCPRSILQQARTPTVSCDRKLRIYAPEHGKYFLLSYHTEMRVVVPTPPSGRRPPGMPATVVVDSYQNTYFERVRETDSHD